MKYYISHDFGISSPLKQKSSENFKNFHKWELLTNFDGNLISFLAGVMNEMF